MSRTWPMITLFGSLALASGCDGGSHNDGASETAAKAEPEKKPPAAEETPLDKPSADWPTLALTKVDDEVDGIKFSLSLPADKLTRDAKANDGTFPGYVTWNGANFLIDPSFTVQLDSSPPIDLADAAHKVAITPQPGEVVRQEQLDGGALMVSFVEKTNQYVRVEAWRTSPSTSKVLRVKVQVRQTEPIPNIDALRSWMETVASSLVVQ